MIQVLHGKGSRANCYSETYYEVVSSRQITDFQPLDALGLLGIGQAYDVVKTEEFTDNVPPVTIDKRTGEVVDIVPRNGYSGEPITGTYEYRYWRYVVRRICDSGD